MSGSQNTSTLANRSKLDIVHPSIVPQLWPLIEQYVKSICNSTNGRMTVEDAYNFIMNQDILLWCAFNKEIEAVGLTEILNYSRKRMCRILGVSGKNKRNWQHYMPIMEEYAKSAGCDGIESIARKGWLKILKDFVSTHVFIEKMFAK